MSGDQQRQDQLLGDQPPAWVGDGGEVESAPVEGHLDWESDHVGEIPQVVVEYRPWRAVRQCEPGFAADVGAGERGPDVGRRVPWSRLCSSCGEFLGAQGDFVVAVGDMGGCGGEFGGVETVEDLVDPGGVGAEDRHEVGGGHLLPLAGEECLEP